MPSKITPHRNTKYSRLSVHRELDSSQFTLTMSAEIRLMPSSTPISVVSRMATPATRNSSVPLLPSTVRWPSSTAWAHTKSMLFL